MAIGRAQTVEDGPPRELPLSTLHHEGTAQEYIRVEMTIRMAWNHHAERRLVLRASQVTGALTASLQTLRTE